MRLRLATALIFALSLLAQAATPDQFEGFYTSKKNGWTYVLLEGTPAQVGFQHCHLLSKGIEDNYHVYRLEKEHNFGRAWNFFRGASKNVPLAEGRV